MSSEAPQTPESGETSNNQKILTELPHQEPGKYFSESVLEEQRSKNRLGKKVLHYIFARDARTCFNVSLPPLWALGL